MSIDISQAKVDDTPVLDLLVLIYRTRPPSRYEKSVGLGMKVCLADDVDR